MRVFNQSYQEAKLYVYNRRNEIQPNPSFENQLLRYQMELQDAQSRKPRRIRDIHEVEIPIEIPPSQTTVQIGPARPPARPLTTPIEPSASGGIYPLNTIPIISLVSETTSNSMPMEGEIPSILQGTVGTQPIDQLNICGPMKRPLSTPQEAGGDNKRLRPEESTQESNGVNTNLQVLETSIV